MESQTQNLSTRRPTRWPPSLDETCGSPDWPSMTTAASSGPACVGTASGPTASARTTACATTGTSRAVRWPSTCNRSSSPRRPTRPHPIAAGRLHVPASRWTTRRPGCGRCSTPSHTCSAPRIYDPFGAQLAMYHGFKAVYFSGYSFAIGHLGTTDMDLYAGPEIADGARRTVAALRKFQLTAAVGDPRRACRRGTSTSRRSSSTWTPATATSSTSSARPSST